MMKTEQEWKNGDWVRWGAGFTALVVGRDPQNHHNTVISTNGVLRSVPTSSLS